MLKKHAYTICITFHTVISPMKLPIKTARQCREIMKQYFDFSQNFEKEANIIIGSEISEDEKKAEIESLENENIDLPEVSNKIIELLEEAKAELSTSDINKLLCYE